MLPSLFYQIRIIIRIRTEVYIYIYIYIYIYFGFETLTKHNLTIRNTMGLHLFAAGPVYFEKEIAKENTDI